MICSGNITTGTNSPMKTAGLPVKNTFVHFDVLTSTDVLDDQPLVRSLTCPPICGCLHPNENSSIVCSVCFPSCGGDTVLAEVCTPTNSAEEENADRIPCANAESAAEACTPTNAAEEKDDRMMATPAAAFGMPDVQEEKEDIMPVQEEKPKQRPVFGRPGREVRMQQARKDTEEICSLEFDAVDASSQMGLVGRMLVMMKSLAQTVVFWEGGQEKRQEEKFRLLGFEEDDMYAIGKQIRRAEKKIDERNFREAFDQMREARRWLDPEWAAAERGRRAEKAAAREEEKKNGKKNGKKEAAVELEREEDAVPNPNGRTTQQQKDEPEWREVRSTTTKTRTWCPGRAATASAVAPSSVETRFSCARRRRGQIAGGAREEWKTKFLCRFPVQIEAELEGRFHVCRRIFGPGGENMKKIAREANAKLRLRGRGSGFKEGEAQEEADIPLELNLSADDRDGYETAKRMVRALLEKIYAQYRNHCSKHKLLSDEVRFPQNLQVRLDEHPENPE